MQRVITRRALVLAAITLWLSTNAVAFTLRVGSIPADEVLLGTLTTDVPDLPTPAFFRFALRPSGVTLGLQQPFGHDPGSQGVDCGTDGLGQHLAGASLAVGHQFDALGQQF